MESQVKTLTEENNRLSEQNKNFVNGVRMAGPQDTDFHPDTDLSNPGAIAEELRRVQRKNDSLKRENEIIRRELTSFKDKFGATGKTTHSNPLGGSSGTGGMDNELRAELEAEIAELKRQNMKLEQRLMNNTLNTSMDNYEKKFGNVVRDYLSQINQLKEENERLKSNHPINN